MQCNAFETMQGDAYPLTVSQTAVSKPSKHAEIKIVPFLIFYKIAVHRSFPVQQEFDNLKKKEP